MTHSLIQVSDSTVQQLIENEGGREGEERMKERGIEGGRDAPPLHPSLSVSHRGGERQATMGPFSAWLKVVI